jgi:hypothetical protein
MGMHTLEELMRKWKRDEVSPEQMLGQLVQHISVLYERLRLLEKAYNAERRAQEQPAAQPVTRSSKAQRG